MAMSTLPTTSTVTRKNIGPLTTIFTAPSYCNNIINGCPTCDFGWLGQTCTNSAADAADDPSCWPPAASGAPPINIPLHGWGFYSPGVACPSGYEPACSKSVGQDGGFEFQYPLISSETAMGCCPTGFTCGHGDQNVQTCISSAYSTSVLTGTCPGNGSAVNYAFKTMPYAAGTAVFQSYVIAAPMYQLVYQQRDLTVTDVGFFGATSSSTASATAVSTNGSTSTLSTSTSPTSQPIASSNLSTGAAIGVGIGGTAVLIVIAALSWFLWRSRQRRRMGHMAVPQRTISTTQYSQPTEYSYTPTPTFHSESAELGGRNERKPQELDPAAVYTPAAAYLPAELSSPDWQNYQDNSHHPRAELPPDALDRGSNKMPTSVSDSLIRGISQERNRDYGEGAGPRY